MEEHTRMGIPLLEAVSTTSHLRARDPDPKQPEQKRPAGQAPPSLGAMAELGKWNEMK